ncbi:hypothetical protein GEMRC1_007220 [Eukaryota sp. GEM-RC1]
MDSTLVKSLSHHHSFHLQRPYSMQIVISRSFITTTLVVMTVLFTSFVKYGLNPFQIFHDDPAAWMQNENMPRFTRFTLVQSLLACPLMLFCLRDIPLQNKNQHILSAVAFRVVLYLSIEGPPVQERIYASGVTSGLFLLNLVPSCFSFHLPELLQHGHYLWKTPSILLSLVVSWTRVISLLRNLNSNPFISSTTIKSALFYDIILSIIYLSRYTYLCLEFGLGIYRHLSSFSCDSRTKIFAFCDGLSIFLIQMSTIYFCSSFLNRSQLPEISFIICLCYFLFSVLPLASPFKRALHLFKTCLMVNRRLLSVVTPVPPSSFSPDEVCAICRASLTQGNPVRLECSHCLHSNCFLSISSSIRRCPICSHRIPLNTSPRPSRSSITHQRVLTMIQEMFPSLSEDVIIAALSRTRSVDLAIEELLTLPQEPEPQEQAHPPSPPSEPIPIQSQQVFRGGNSSSFSTDSAIRAENLRQRFRQMREFARNNYMESHDH